MREAKFSTIASWRAWQKQYGRSFLISFLIHSVMIVMLFISIQSIPMSTKAPAHVPAGEIVQATMVDQKLVDVEIKRLENEEKQQKAEIQKVEQAKQERLKVEAKVKELKKELAAAKIQEEARLAEIKLAKEKERKQLEQLRKEKEKEQKKLAALDERRQEEQDRVEQLRLNRTEEEKKQNTLNEKQQTSGKNGTQKSNELQTAERQSFLMSELAKYQALFRDKVNQSWIRAPGLPEGLLCMLEIRLLPDGQVVNVQVINSSGNLAFDQAAVAAVNKASPLPVPEDVELVEKFKHFTFEFKPPEAS